MSGKTRDDGQAQPLAAASAKPRRQPKPPPGSGKADPEQYQRFLEAARELGCEENAERMDEVVRRAAKLSPQREWPKAKKGT
jgi:hypothetical protein